MAEASANQNVRLVRRTDDDGINLNNEKFYNSKWKTFPKWIMMNYLMSTLLMIITISRSQRAFIIRCHLQRRTIECGEYLLHCYRDNVS